MEYKYSNDNVSCKNILSYVQATRMSKIMFAHKLLHPAAIRIRERIGHVIVLTLYQSNPPNNFGIIREDRVDLKFKDNSIRTAEILTTINLSSRS